MTAPVPDTITSWVLSAISLHDDSGLGILEPPVKFTVFKPFFVEPLLPYSMKRREILRLDIVVFNYLGKAQSTVVSVSRADAKFEGTEVEKSGWKGEEPVIDRWGKNSHFRLFYSDSVELLANCCRAK